MKYRCVFSSLSCIAIIGIFFQRIKRGICRGRNKPRKTPKAVDSDSSEESLNKCEHIDTEDVGVNS
ncbi:putative integral membrane protein [Theileria parva strain Muguga]|uniref:putative integral membrane protein n=1 Tax=Theileria parva strain Muguga TaxID=333668 RepID=UPI001C623015|nr:putative integral membrane protein [Theileria parva strain Muguga]KAF5153697.1 putative integral membrane protein [Theileria parva strain Muguga]